MLLAFVVLALVLLSPLGLGAIEDAGDRDWRRLSEIGQTYGAVSALFSVVALGGVVASLMLQARAAFLDRELAHRTIHVELLKMAIDDPDLLKVWEPRGTTKLVSERRCFAYINLFVSFWEMAYDLRIRTAEELAASADGSSSVSSGDASGTSSVGTGLRGASGCVNCIASSTSAGG
jgi:uncharacterized protein DUF6082